MVFPVAPCKTDRAWAEKTADFVDPTPLGLVAPLNTMAGAGKVLTLAHQDTHPAGPYFSVSGSELTSEGEAWPLAFMPNEVASSVGTDYFECESVVQGIGYLKLTDDSTTQFVPMVNVSIKGWALDVGCTDVGITVVGSILESDGDTYSFTVGGTTKTLRQWAGPPLTDRWTIVVNVRADQTPFDFDPFTP